MQEDSITPELLWIDDLEKSVQNKGVLSISPTDYHERDNGKEMRDFDMGMIMINLTNPVQEVGMASSPAIWSRPMPLGKCLFLVTNVHYPNGKHIIILQMLWVFLSLNLGWYFAEQWRRYIGNNWQQNKCDAWTKRDRMLKRYANELPMVFS